MASYSCKAFVLMSIDPSNAKVSARVVAFLRKGASYPGHVPSVQLKETHISWVFLAGHHAFKLKKPVRFDFLDFSTADKRRDACQRELSLNRRLAPHVYLEVLPVLRRAGGGFALGRAAQVGDGAVDWVVKMRRLNEQQTLEHQLTEVAAAATNEEALRNVARRLAKFYAAQAPLTLRTSDFRDRLRAHMRDNQAALLRLTTSAAETDTVEQVHSYQWRFSHLHAELFDNRVRDGRVVDGHGDLRPDHIFLNHPTVIVDCIEFNDEFRQNDILDELAFLTMESERLGCSTAGSILFDTYGSESGDHGDERLIAFYKCYRACVRAKIASLRCGQREARPTDAAHAEVRSYLDLASRYLPGFGSPLVVLVGGHMGSGKTALAKRLAERLAARVVSTDVLRPSVSGGGRFSYDEGRYALPARMENYRAMTRQASRELQRTGTVVLDGSFTTRAMRRLAKELADAEGARLVQLECVCPQDVAVQRIQQRAASGPTPSEARGELLEQQVAEREPPLATVPYLEIDTTMATGEQDRLADIPIREILEQEGAS